jgi:hypothetical protein
MERIVKVPFQGSQEEGIELDFKTTNEEWNEYQTSDGSTIRIKLVMTNIVKLNKTDPQGNPIFVAKTSNVMAVSPPQSPKRGTVN